MTSIDAGNTEVGVGAAYPVAALAVEKEGACAAAGPESELVAEVGGMILAIVVDSLVGLTAAPGGAAGGVIAENDGESVGSVNPDVGPDVDLLAAAEVIGGGVNELVVEGVVNGAVVEAIAAP